MLGIRLHLSRKRIKPSYWLIDLSSSHFGPVFLQVSDAHRTLVSLLFSICVSPLLQMRWLVLLHMTLEEQLIRARSVAAIIESFPCVPNLSSFLSRLHILFFPTLWSPASFLSFSICPSSPSPASPCPCVPAPALFYSPPLALLLPLPASSVF